MQMLQQHLHQHQRSISKKMSENAGQDIELQLTENPMTAQRASEEPRVSAKVEPKIVKILGVAFEDHKDATLREKLAYMKHKMETDEEIDGDLPNEKGKRPFDIKAKYRKIMRTMTKAKEEEAFRDEIVAFKYATDMSILRRCTPEEVWHAVKRREAWHQVPHIMCGVSAAQVLLCFICLLTNNSPINASTSLMAAVYVITVCASNAFVKCGDVTNYIRQWFHLVPPRKKDEPVRKPNYVGLIAFCILGSPVIALVYSVAFLLDICIGEIVDLSYGELFNVLVNVIVIFTGFSVGLRSGNAVGAVQTFAGFSFISEMDEMVMDTIEVDLDAKASHVHGKGKQRKILTVRVVLYVLTPMFLVFFMWVTFTNTCLAFCNDG